MLIQGNKIKSVGLSGGTVDTVVLDTIRYGFNSHLGYVWDNSLIGKVFVSKMNYMGSSPFYPD